MNEPYVDADIMELFEERSAIVEYDGKLPRAEAEAIAIAEIEKTFGRVPETVLERYKKTIVVMKELG